MSPCSQRSSKLISSAQVVVGRLVPYHLISTVAEVVDQQPLVDHPADSHHTAGDPVVASVLVTEVVLVVPLVGVGVDDVLADDAAQVLIGVVGGGPISQSQVGSFTDFFDMAILLIQIICSTS